MKNSGHKLSDYELDAILEFWFQFLKNKWLNSKILKTDCTLYSQPPQGMDLQGKRIRKKRQGKPIKKNANIRDAFWSSGKPLYRQIIS